MRALVLGASGMLGNAVYRTFAESEELQVVGTARSRSAASHLPSASNARLAFGVDVGDLDALTKLLAEIRPDVVVNCIGLVKQLSDAKDPLHAIPINSLLPHRLAGLCNLAGARLIHVSTDCVFSGSRGNYVETDPADADDLYGRSKLLGEVSYPHAITLRTSIIGHELDGAHSLIGWFLSQHGTVKGFAKAIFSGLPTVELARIMRDVVIPRPDLHGLYHVAAEPISKFDLLELVADCYGKPIDIVRDESLVIDRSLSAARFNCEAGYSPPAWPELVRRMRDFG